MVCSLGSGRMEAMARLLATGGFSQTVAEEVGHQKLAAQYIQRELHEAYEASFLDEEDMHVFDLKPMTDPLHLKEKHTLASMQKPDQILAELGLVLGVCPLAMNFSNHVPVNNVL